MDWDREFKAAGGASVISGLGGGPPGFVNFPESIMSHPARGRVTTHRRRNGPCGGLRAAGGDEFVGFVPVPLLAGIALFAGVSLVHEWLVRSRKRLPWILHRHPRSRVR